MSESHLEELRPRAFAVAYRMLGSVSEAEDVVQEAFLRLHNTLQRGERVESPRAYIATVVTRLSIDQLRSARARRDTYVGEWLPEPLITSTDQDPAQHAEMVDSLSLAFLVLLESLSPEQRAAFLLRDVFDYPYDEIGRIVGKNPDNTRQLVTRPRKYLQSRRPRFEASPERRDILAQTFFTAIEEGDLTGLEQLLADDVVLHGDGGGRVPAIKRPVYGRSVVARALLSWARLGENAGGFTVRRIDVNGQSGAMVLSSESQLIGVLALDIAEEHVRAVNSIINPDKLRHLGPVGDMRSLLRARE